MAPGMKCTIFHMIFAPLAERDKKEKNWKGGYKNGKL
jgi:hypothetical protein